LFAAATITKARRMIAKTEGIFTIPEVQADSLFGGNIVNGEASVRLGG